MLRLVAALALARAAELTAPGTGYSDADSCPPPEKTPFGAVVTHSCTFCASTLTKAPLINKDAAWQSVAFANHATQTARLVEVDAAGRELPRGTVAPGAEKTFRCQVGTTWRARSVATNEILLEHRVGHVRLVDVSDWLGEVNKHASEDCCKLIIGNKSDAPGRAVTAEEARAKSEELACPFLETSAKASTNVEEAFLTLASELLRRTPPEKPQKKRLSLAASAKEKGRKCCS